MVPSSYSSLIMDLTVRVSNPRVEIAVKRETKDKA
jgi:hypothetical protein